jgi:hypothetical protein
MNRVPTTQRIISIVVDPELHERLRAAAHRSGKSVSRFVRELVEERVRPRSTRPRRGRSVLLKLCGLAHGELTGRDIDRELYGS